MIKNLFAGDNLIGKTIRIKNLPFLVGGTLQSKGQSLDSRDQDDTVLMPITTPQGKLFGNPFPGTVRFISVQGKSAEVMDEAEVEMKQLLRVIAFRPAAKTISACAISPPPPRKPCR